MRFFFTTIAGESLKQTRVPVRSDSTGKDQRIHVRTQTEDLEGARWSHQLFVKFMFMFRLEGTFYNVNS